MNLVLNILRSMDLFHSLTEEEHMSIVNQITMQYFPPNYTLFEKGQTGEAMYIIKTGRVKIVDQPTTLASLSNGDFFGEMALIENRPRMASAITESEAEIFVLKKAEFLALLESSPSIKEKVYQAYADRKTKNDSV